MSLRSCLTKLVQAVEKAKQGLGISNAGAAVAFHIIVSSIIAAVAGVCDGSLTKLGRGGLTEFDVPLSNPPD